MCVEAMTRVLLTGCDPFLRERLRGELESRGAEAVIAEDDASAARELESQRWDGIVTGLDPTPRSSGLALLAAARVRVPIARRVLVIERRVLLADAAVAAGLADRVLSGVSSSARIGALAEWLVSSCDHGPRRYDWPLA